MIHALKDLGGSPCGYRLDPQVRVRYMVVRQCVNVFRAPQ